MKFIDPARRHADRRRGRRAAQPAPRSGVAPRAVTTTSNCRRCRRVHPADAHRVPLIRVQTLMTSTRFLTAALSVCAAVLLVRTGSCASGPAAAGRAAARRSATRRDQHRDCRSAGAAAEARGAGLHPAVRRPETVAAAKTIGEVLYDDMNFEREFYLIPRDTYRSIPKPTSADQVPLDRWKELNADGVIVGHRPEGPERLRGGGAADPGRGGGRRSASSTAARSTR